MQPGDEKVRRVYAILFGPSMDYQVFLLTRIHEEWNRTGSNPARRGLAVTGRTITSAALIMTVVLASFRLADLQVVKELGLGLAGGILIDALFIRSAIVLSDADGRQGQLVDSPLA